ncbi:MAG: F0F1 ATP synthase subunit gamma [Campylobacteraceae bacterium]|jgi:F-type H+-transporting ATPase subunit gamma|nr:F0F1 ATP synthase subunit gamma [Campylobacteraceae bacterium]
MSNLKEIKRKIKSVKNTQKTTRAMKLVSSSKLRKAEKAAKQSRIYADKINELLSEISLRLPQFLASDGAESRFINTKIEPKVVDIIFVTADKGLCGGFNIQTIKMVKNLLEEYKSKKIKVRLRAVGRKGVDYFSFQGVDILKKYVGVSSAPTYSKAKDIIDDSVSDFMGNLTDKIVLVHNGYLNMISQELKVVDVLPVEPPIKESTEVLSLLETEPEDNNKILEELMKKYLEYNMYYALIDSLAAEHSARMQAMDNATNNAKERVSKLTISYNKARQESITTELIEIISGMESMK